MSNTKTNGSQSKTSSYSKEYLTIRKQAESNWPAWKVSTYNTNFATSKHAKKVASK